MRDVMSLCPLANPNAHVETTRGFECLLEAKQEWQI